MKHICSRKHYTPEQPTTKEFIYICLSGLTGLHFKKASEYYRREKQNWKQFVNAIQTELDQQIKNGFSFRAIDGKRVVR